MLDLIDRFADLLLAQLAPKAAADAKQTYCWRTTITCGFCGCQGSRAWYHIELHCDDGGKECLPTCDYSTVC